MTQTALQQNESYRSEYLSLLENLSGDEAGRKAAWQRMAQSDYYYHGEPVAFSFMPTFYGAATHAYLKEVAEVTYAILAQVIEHYRSDAAYRQEFRFDARIERLLNLPCVYDEPLPLVRVDCMYDEANQQAVFCEFNADAQSGMYENLEALACIRKSVVYEQFEAKHQLHDDVKRHFDGLVQTFLRLRMQALEREGKSPEKPHMAIAVCFDSPSPELGEVRAYAKLFEAAGMPCSVFDVRELEYDGASLIGHRALVGQSEVVVDSIWRYVILVDLLEHWDDVQGFIAGIEHGAAVMIGGFATQIIHDKQVFAVLHKPATKEFLSSPQQAFIERSIPQTYFLHDPSLDLQDIRSNKDQWVIKPADWYASINVTCGADCTQEEWEAIQDACLQQACGSPWLAQRFHAPYETPAIPLYGREEDFKNEPQMFGNIVGLYLYAGEFSGVYVRQGPHGVIGSAREGLVSPVLWVDVPKSPEPLSVNVETHVVLPICK